MGFGISPGPYRHLRQARLRAIAEGLPLIRAAKPGTSALIDPMGRIVAGIGLGAERVLDSGLPAMIVPTTYARVSDIPTVIAVAVAVIFVLQRRAIKAVSQETHLIDQPALDNYSAQIPSLPPFARSAKLSRAYSLSEH
jgi:apolipoprotein N-acyltransferase